MGRQLGPRATAPPPERNHQPTVDNLNARFCLFNLHGALANA